MTQHKNTFFIIITLPFLITFVAGCGAGGGGAITSDNPGTTNQSLGKNISITTTDSFNPVIAADSTGNVYISWEEAISDSKKEIYLGTSSNSGLTFSSRKSITKESKPYCGSIGTIQGDVNMGLGDNDSLYLSWIDQWPNYQVSEVKSFNEDSATCNSVSNTYNSATNVYSPHMRVKGSNVHLLWAEDYNGIKKISYAHSTDYGKTFEVPRTISNPGSDSSEPLLGFDGTLGIVDTVWVEGKEPARTVNFSRSEDNGKTFSTPLFISSAAADAHCPAFVSSGAGKKIYVTYKGDNYIYYARWDSATPSSFTDVGYITESVSPSCPEMGISSNGIIYVTWSDNGKIWVAKSTDATTFTTISISDNTLISSSPKMSIDGEYVNIVWVGEGTGPADIYFAGSIDKGKSYSPPRNLSDSAAPSLSPVITTDGNYIYVAWTEGNPGSREVYFIRDKGARGLLNP